jgi:hypothetical protein
MKFRTCATIFFPAVAALVTVALAEYYVSPTSPGTCGKTCRFTFCPAKADFHFPIGKPDIAVTPAICDATGQVVVGHVGATSEAYVANSNAGAVPISSFSPSGLRQKFSPSFFKSFGLTDGSGLSGVGHETPQQNQASYLDKLCVILPSTLITIHMSIAWPS